MTTQFKTGDQVWVTSEGVIDSGYLSHRAEVTHVSDWGTHTVKSLDGLFNEQGWGREGIYATKAAADSAGRVLVEHMAHEELARHSRRMASLLAPLTR